MIFQKDIWAQIDLEAAKASGAVDATLQFHKQNFGTKPIKMLDIIGESARGLYARCHVLGTVSHTNIYLCDLKPYQFKTGDKVALVRKPTKDWGDSWIGPMDDLFTSQKGKVLTISSVFNGNLRCKLAGLDYNWPIESLDIVEPMTEGVPYYPKPIYADYIVSIKQQTKKPLRMLNE